MPKLPIWLTIHKKSEKQNMGGGEDTVFLVNFQKTNVL